MRGSSCEEIVTWMREEPDRSVRRNESMDVSSCWMSSTMPSVRTGVKKGLSRRSASSVMSDGGGSPCPTVFSVSDSHQAPCVPDLIKRHVSTTRSPRRRVPAAPWTQMGLQGP